VDRFCAAPVALYTEGIWLGGFAVLPLILYTDLSFSGIGLSVFGFSALNSPAGLDLDSSGLWRFTTLAGCLLMLIGWCALVACLD
jgi:hypothetical protein